MGMGDLANKRTFTSDEARAIATTLGIDFGASGAISSSSGWGWMWSSSTGLATRRLTSAETIRSSPARSLFAHLTEVPGLLHSAWRSWEREAAEHASGKK